MKRFFSLFLPLTVCLIIYQNCGDKSFSTRTDSTQGSLSGGDTAGGSTDGGNTSGGINDDDVIQTKTDCDNAKKLNKLMLLNQKIVFDDTKMESGRNQVCEFSINGNLDMLNTQMQARYEQYRNLNLPTNAVVCDVNMTTPIQSFKYDDVFFLTFNGRILATNNKTALYQTTPEQTLNIQNAGPVSIYKYDWFSLRTKRFENVADDYCLGKSQGAASCQWPITEQVGNIQFDFDQQLLIALGLLSASNQQQFGFIITGDNDPSVDCYHERLEFDMNVQYYIK